MSKRDEILEIATQTFREYGYQRANLSDIAGQCGMNKAGLYYYFKNKEDIFISMLKKDIGSISDKLTAILSEPVDMIQRLRTFMIYRTSSFGLMKKYLEMFSHGVVPPKLRELAFRVKQEFSDYEIEHLTRFLTLYIEQTNLKGVKPYYLTLILVSVSEKIGMLSFHDNTKINIEETIEEVLQLLLLNHSNDKENNR